MTSMTLNRTTNTGNHASPQNWVRAGVIGFLLVVGGCLQVATASGNSFVVPSDRTSASPLGRFSTVMPVSSAAAIAEVRRLGRFQWGELATLFDVSVRTLHLWANGERLSPANERALFSVLTTLRALSTGDSAKLRAKLFATANGASLFEYMRQGHFDIALSNAESFMQTRNWVELDDSAKAAGRPMSVGLSLSGVDGPVEVNEEPLIKKRVFRVG